MEVFTTNLSALMDHKGVDYHEMANDLDVEVTRVRRWFSKICFPKHSMMIRLCDYFGYRDIYKLLTEKIIITDAVPAAVE